MKLKHLYHTHEKVFDQVSLKIIDLVVLNSNVFCMSAKHFMPRIEIMKSAEINMMLLKFAPFEILLTLKILNFKELFFEIYYFTPETLLGGTIAVNYASENKYSTVLLTNHNI